MLFDFFNYQELAPGPSDLICSSSDEEQIIRHALQTAAGILNQRLQSLEINAPEFFRCRYLRKCRYCTQKLERLLDGPLASRMIFLADCSIAASRPWEAWDVDETGELSKLISPKLFFPMLWGSV